MSQLESIMFILLWIVIITEGVLLFILYRHIARQLSRGQSQGLQPGINAPNFTGNSIRGHQVALKDLLNSSRNLLIFASSECSVCHTLLTDPRINSLAEVNKIQTAFLFKASKSNPDEALPKSPFNSLTTIFIPAQTFKDYEVAVTPFAYFLDEEGQVLARDAIQNFDHLATMCNDIWRISASYDPISSVELVTSR
jgi:hypothetical protein